MLVLLSRPMIRDLRDNKPVLAPLFSACPRRSPRLSFIDKLRSHFPFHQFGFGPTFKALEFTFLPLLINSSLFKSTPSQLSQLSSSSKTSSIRALLGQEQLGDILTPSLPEHPPSSRGILTITFLSRSLPGSRTPLDHIIFERGQLPTAHTAVSQTAP